MGRGAIAAILLATFLLLPVEARASISEDDFVTLMPVDAIAAILQPRFEEPSWLSPEDLVLGVAMGGEARAYPIRILNWHEIVNDVVGGLPIAATYCPLCATGMVYDRRVEGQVLTFRVSGKLYRNDLVMVDTETGSLWPQILGRAATGPLRGADLALIPSWTTTLGAWREAHPDTLVLARPRCDEPLQDRSGLVATHCQQNMFQRFYENDPYSAYNQRWESLVPRPFGDDGSDIHPKELVLGVVHNHAAKAYPLKILRVEGLVNDFLGGTAIVVTFAEGSSQAFEAGHRRFSRLEGRLMVDQEGLPWDIFTGSGPGGSLPRLKSFHAFWFAWYDFYPDTLGYGFRVGPQGWTVPLEPVLLVGIPVTIFSLLMVWPRGRGRRSRTGLSHRKGLADESWRADRGGRPPHFHRGVAWGRRM
jgi:hypothetical protein